MSEPVFPPSVGTLCEESRMDFDVDAFARLAHDLYDQPSLEKDTRENRRIRRSGTGL